MLGASWPIMRIDFAADESLAGVFNAAISICTVISSLSSSRLTRRFGTGKVIGCSVTLTAIGLVTAFFINNVYLMFIVTVPMGLGAGAIDTILNDYVARNYKAIHMNWLHCCWGVGAMAGSLVVSSFIKNDLGWRYGFLAVGLVQAVLAAVMFLSLPLWQKAAAKDACLTADSVPENTFSENKIELPKGTASLSITDKEVETSLKTVKKPSQITLRKALSVRGVALGAVAFFFYCSIESIVGLWGSSYMVNVRNAAPATAALLVSAFYGGIIGGRFLNGILSLKLGEMWLVRGGFLIILTGAILLLCPLSNVGIIFGMALIGVGCAPIYPSLMHLTPVRFGAELSATVVSFQSATTYLSFLLSPIIFGLVATNTTFKIMPYVLLVLLAGVVIMNELTHILSKKYRKETNNIV